MTDITDLIARVRELQAKANPPQTPGYVRVGEANLTEWAAVIDEIPALATECERLRERVARLEEALREIAGYDLRAEHSESAAHEMRDEARAALKGTP